MYSDRRIALDESIGILTEAPDSVERALNNPNGANYDGLVDQAGDPISSQAPQQKQQAQQTSNRKSQEQQSQTDGNNSELRQQDQDSEQKPTKTRTSSVDRTDALTKEQQEAVRESGKNIKEESAKLLQTGKIVGLENFNEWGEPLKTEAVDSIMERGTKYADNPFLRYLKMVAKNSSVTKINNIAVFETLKDLIQRGDIDITNTRKLDWLNNNLSYTARDRDSSVFKIKALALLTSDKAINYGKVADAPIDSIMKATTKDEISELLTGWQTKYGDKRTTAGDRKQSGSGGDKLKASEANRLATKALANVPRTINISTSSLRDYIIDNATTRDTADSALGKAIRNALTQAN